MTSVLFTPALATATAAALLGARSIAGIAMPCPQGAVKLGVCSKAAMERAARPETEDPTTLDRLPESEYHVQGGFSIGRRNDGQGRGHSKWSSQGTSKRQGRQDTRYAESRGRMSPT